MPLPFDAFYLPTDDPDTLESTQATSSPSNSNLSESCIVQSIKTADRTHFPADAAS